MHDRQADLLGKPGQPRRGRRAATHQFRQIDICDAANLRAAFFDFAPDAIMHLAAETHVDRSIDDPSAFIQANVVGTFQVLEVAREFARKKGDSFRLLHVSTDEVYGTLGATDRFTEDSSLQPELAVLGVEGGIRSSGACLVRNLSTARSRHELLRTTTGPISFPKS